MDLGDVVANAKSSLDLYFFGLDKTKTKAFSTAPAVSVDSDTYTIGTRFVTKPKPWDLEGGGGLPVWPIRNWQDQRVLHQHRSGLQLRREVRAAGVPRVRHRPAATTRPNSTDKQTFNQLFPPATASLATSTPSADRTSSTCTPA